MLLGRGVFSSFFALGKRERRGGCPAQNLFFVVSLLTFYVLVTRYHNVTSPLFTCDFDETMGLDHQYVYFAVAGGKAQSWSMPGLLPGVSFVRTG